MEALRQSLKIGAGLAVMVALCVAILPERPSLFSAGTVEAAVDGEDRDLLLANAAELDAAPRGTVEMAQAPTPAADGLTEGQRHLQRLRERNRPPAASSPQPEPEAPAAPPQPAASELVAPAPSVGGGQGLDTLARPSQPPQFRLFRSAEAVDSATLRSGDETIRVAGAVPVGADEVCADGSACGAEAREALAEWLTGQEIVCAVPGGTAGSVPAPCVRGEEDIADWLVTNGWAEAEPGSVYEEAEARARDAGAGIWGSGGR